jgi:transcriptional regulator with XRE-family HTH domain
METFRLFLSVLPSKETAESDLLKCDLSSVGGRLRYYRFLSGLGQKDVADKLSLSKGTIKKYENPNNDSHCLHICENICKLLGVKKKKWFMTTTCFLLTLIMGQP